MDALNSRADDPAPTVFGALEVLVCINLSRHFQCLAIFFDSYRGREIWALIPVLAVRSHPGRVSYFPLRSGWFGFVRGFGFVWGGCGSLVDWGCATMVGVAGVCGRAGVAGLLGLLRGGAAFHAFSMPGYLLCPLPGSGTTGLDPSFVCAVSPGTGELLSAAFGLIRVCSGVRVCVGAGTALRLMEVALQR